MTRQSHQSTPPRVDKSVPELDEHRARLVARGRELLDLQIAREGESLAGTATLDVERRVADKTRELLNGHAAEVLKARPDSISLEDIRIERQAVDRAVRLISERRSAILAERARAVLAARADEWRALVHGGVRAACALRAFNKARVAYRADVALAGHSRLPCDQFLLLGPGPAHGGVGTELDAFLEAAIAAGITTAGEVKKLTEIEQ